MAGLADRLGGIRQTAESDRVTTFELFFDLVFVFAFTQVTALMATEHDLIGVIRGVLVLALIWWSWTAYAWLGNQARADVGLIQVGMIVALAAMFVVALAIPEAWSDLPGGLSGPLVLGVAYIVVRAVHLLLFLAAAQGDADLRHQLLVALIPWGLGSTMLVAGSLVGGTTQTLLWAGGLALDMGGTYLTSRQGNWRLRSPRHWAERHGLVIILAIGESIVAIGVGASQLPISTTLVLGAIVGVLLAAGLWWSYFDSLADRVEQVLIRLTDREQVRFASDAYSYLHFPLVLGIVLAALGLEDALANIGEAEPYGAFGAGALTVGLALSLVGQAALWRRSVGSWPAERLILAAALLASWPLLASVRPLAAVAVAVVVLWLHAVAGRARATQRSSTT